MIRTSKSCYTIQNVDKAFELLEAIAESTGSATLPELAARLNLSRNKTFRLISTLGERDLVERDTLTGRYQLGISAYELAQRFLHTASLINHAHPVMEQLARKHHEAVYMTVLKGEEVLFLDMVDCEQQIKAVPLVGKRFPFFTNAAGKALKAQESVDLLEKLRRGKPGIPDPKQLTSELFDIRQKGVAVDYGGLGDGINSVAVAVKDYAGKVVGALTMLGPSFRLFAERVENEIIPSLFEGATALSEKFGYTKG